MRYTKEQRRTAKEDGLGLVTIAVDGRHLPAGETFGGIEFSGPVTGDVAREVAAFLADLLKNRIEDL